MAVPAAREALEVREGDLVEPLLGAHLVEDHKSARDEPQENKEKDHSADDAGERSVIACGLLCGAGLIDLRGCRPRGEVPDDAADLVRVHVACGADNRKAARLLVKRDDVVVVGILAGERNRAAHNPSEMRREGAVRYRAAADRILGDPAGELGVGEVLPADVALDGIGKRRAVNRELVLPCLALVRNQAEIGLSHDLAVPLGAVPGAAVPEEVQDPLAVSGGKEIEPACRIEGCMPGELLARVLGESAELRSEGPGEPH